MNTPLRKVAAACFVLFALLLINVNYVQVVKAKDYAKDPRNARLITEAYSRERGAIAIGTGGRRQALATSRRTEGRLTYLREYPAGPLFGHITGYISLVYGATGIERSENDVLSGDSDRLFVRRVSDIITGREPKGGSVVLTLDRAAQEAAFAGLGGKRGAVVAIDPRTGAVLAMASTPSYDPTVLSSHDPKAIRAAWKKLEQDENDPLVNRAISTTYPPGSTFKVVTAAAALATGRYTPTSEVPSPRELKLPQTNQPLRNFGRAACGAGDTMPFQDALKVSCNTTFGALGLELGEDALREQAEKFGLGKDDLRLPDRVAASVFPPELSPPQRAQVAIGQYDLRVTPLQMALVAAGVANGGTVMRPYLVREIQAPDLSRLDRAEPKIYSQAVSRDVAAGLTQMMELVVAEGSGRRAQIQGVRVAGKTGTAQHAPGKPPHAWFIGFAPADDPQVAVAVVIEDGGSLGSEATGGQLSAPIARAVMGAVLGR
ncbi:MAG TPA: penicillin-binding protein 2 [Mycobacteriales bacterium]|nr:penicillin-binding protein 2 [Mycobacteriales bacterium]